MRIIAERYLDKRYRPGCTCRGCYNYRKEHGIVDNGLIKGYSGTFTLDEASTDFNTWGTNMQYLGSGIDLFKNNREKYIVLDQNGNRRGNFKKEKDAVKEIGNLFKTSISDTFYIYEAVAEFRTKAPEMEREEL